MSRALMAMLCLNALTNWWQALIWTAIVLLWMFDGLRAKLHATDKGEG